ncbi:MAG: hypothetical protein WBC74_02210 [Candidatus Omnitrophota bacterium]
MSIIAEALKKAQKSPSQRKKTFKPNFVRLRVYLVFAAAGSALLLAILLLSFLGRSLLGRNEKVAGPAAAASPSYALEADEVKQEEIAETAPLLPAYVTLAEVNESIKVSGIMYTPKKPLVVINDSIWGEGDTVGKFKIIKIERNFIKVDSNGQDFIVKLKR